MGGWDFRPLASWKPQGTASWMPPCSSRGYLLGQLPPPLLASLVSPLQVSLMLGLESLHGHFQAQFGVLGGRQLVLQLCHLRSQVTSRLICRPAGSLQLMYLVGGESEHGAPGSLGRGRARTLGE